MVMARRSTPPRGHESYTGDGPQCSNEIRAMPRLLPENLDAKRLTRSDGIKRSERRYDRRGTFVQVRALGVKSQQAGAQLIIIAV